MSAPRCLGSSRECAQPLAARRDDCLPARYKHHRTVSRRHDLYIRTVLSRFNSACMRTSGIASWITRPQWHLGTLEASLARVTARPSTAKITWTVETDVLDQTARVAKAVGYGAAPSLPFDPGQRANVARDFKPDINT
jgi:hypothetical protein